MRRDLEILSRGPVTLYHAPGPLAADTGWLRDHGYQVTACECARWPEGSGPGLAAAFGARSSGSYVDLDVLTDLLRGWSAGSGFALVLHSYDSFTRRDQDRAQALLDVLAEGSRYQLVHGHRFIVLVQTNDKRIEFEPVGATAVEWNDAEWG